MRENKLKHPAQNVPSQDCAPAASFEARQLAKGLTLVPCWVANDDGPRVHGCKWVKKSTHA